ncbi:MAG: hypothetical protein ACT4O9_06350 [Blastocatellia bacterium]
MTRLEESLTYDKVGNVKTRIDTAVRTTGYDYDTSNRLIKITDAASQLTQFEYNLRSQMTKVKDALNQEYVFTYDALGRQLSQTRAGSTMTFEYDAVGNRTLRTDYMGRKTEYEYAAPGRRNPDRPVRPPSRPARPECVREVRKERGSLKSQFNTWLVRVFRGYGFQA